MSYIHKIIDLVDEINRKTKKDEISARFHMTRHEIKVQVFDNGFDKIVAPINVRVRYFNSEKAELKLRDLHLKLHAYMDEYL